MAPGEGKLGPAGWAKKMQEDIAPPPSSTPPPIDHRLGDMASSSRHSSRRPSRPPPLPSWLSAPVEGGDAKPALPVTNNQPSSFDAESRFSPFNTPASSSPSRIPNASRKSAPTQAPPARSQTLSSPAPSSSATRSTRNTSDSLNAVDSWDDAEALQCWTMFWSPHYEPINRMQSSLKQANAFNGWRRQNGYEGKPRTWKAMENLIEGFKRDGVSQDELRRHVRCSGYGDGNRSGLSESGAKSLIQSSTPNPGSTQAQSAAKSAAKSCTPTSAAAQPDAMARAGAPTPASARSTAAASADESFNKRTMASQLTPGGLPDVYPDVRRKLFTNPAPAGVPATKGIQGLASPQNVGHGRQSVPLRPTTQLPNRSMTASGSTSATAQPSNGITVTPMMSAELTRRFGALTPEQMQKVLEALGVRKKTGQGSSKMQSASPRPVIEVDAKPTLQRRAIGTGGASARSTDSSPARNSGSGQVTQGRIAASDQPELKRRKTANSLTGPSATSQAPDVRRQLFLPGPSSKQGPAAAPMLGPIADPQPARATATPPRIQPTASSMRAATTTLFPGALPPPLPANTFREIPASAMNSEIAACAEMTRLMKTMIKDYIAKGGRPEDARQAVGILAREMEERAMEDPESSR